ncbi:hypothetical protein ACFX19_019422 [Malus domestica]
MGSVSLKIDDGIARFRRTSLCSSTVNLLMLFSVITTNLFALYAFTCSPKDHQTYRHLHHTQKNISLFASETYKSSLLHCGKRKLFPDVLESPVL